MMIDGLEWMDWLHKIREDANNEREKEGISIAEYLRRIKIENKAITEKIWGKTADSVENKT
jgi:hypothetical protein